MKAIPVSAHLKVPLALVLLVVGHLLLVLLEIASFRRLQVEPSVAERLNVRQQSFDERMEVLLLLLKHRTIHANQQLDYDSESHEK